MAFELAVLVSEHEAHSTTILKGALNSVPGLVQSRVHLRTLVVPKAEWALLRDSLDQGSNRGDCQSGNLPLRPSVAGRSRGRQTTDSSHDAERNGCLRYG